jgi:hypothetical protein
MIQKNAIPIFNCQVKIYLDKNKTILESLYISPYPHESLVDLLTEQVNDLIQKACPKNKTISFEILTTTRIGESSHKYLWKPGKTRFLISRHF